jgi:hypothetical protein
MFLLSAMAVMTVAPLEAVHADGASSTVTIASVDQNNNTLVGYFSELQVAPYGPGNVVATGVTPATFATTTGSVYTLQTALQGAQGNCTFTRWSESVSGNPITFTATSGQLSFTAVYYCSNSIPRTGAITIYDHRAPQSDWAQCFALACNLGTGPGASMYVLLYNSAGTIVATGFSNEDGLTFTGLSLNATYYVYPADCDLCHGSTHDVLFSYWGNFWGNGTIGSDTRPLAVIANGSSVNAWYTCTNGCGGV